MEVFDHVVLISSADALAGRMGDNFVLVASASPLPVQALRTSVAAVARPTAVLDGQSLAGFRGNAGTLTDDFAAVDQLLTHQ